MSAPTEYLTRAQADELGLMMAEDAKAMGYELARMPLGYEDRILPIGAVIEQPGHGKLRVVRMVNRRQVLLEPLPAPSEETPSVEAQCEDLGKRRNIVVRLAARLVAFFRLGREA